VTPINRGTPLQGGRRRTGQQVEPPDQAAHDPQQPAIGVLLAASGSVTRHVPVAGGPALSTGARYP
jgi:hypothetical protein